jgi:hypothetical protein
MSLDQHARVTVRQDGASVSKPGYGVPAGLSVNATWVERSRTYSGIQAVAADWDSDTPEYRFAARTFGQTPRPPSLKILRAVGKPTQAYTVSVINVKNDHTYQVDVVGTGVTTTTVEYESDADATEDEITAGLTAALNDVTGKNYTAVDGVDGTIAITGSSAGAWFSLQIRNLDDLGITQDHAEPGTALADDLDAILLEDRDWYALETFYNSEDYILATAAWCETNKRLYMANSCDTSAATVAESGGSDVLKQLNDLNYEYSAHFYHWSPAEMMGAGWLGQGLPHDPGTETWAYMTITGITAPPLNDTHRANLDARRASYYKSAGGNSFTWEGKLPNTTVRFIDSRRLLDWIQSEVQVGIFGQLLGAVGKVPYTRRGMLKIENAIRAVFGVGQRREAIATDPEPTVTLPELEDIPPADIADRVLDDVQATCRATGAIHSVDVDIIVSP